MSVHPARQEVTDDRNCIRVSLLKGANFDTLGRERNVGVWIALIWARRSDYTGPSVRGSCQSSVGVGFVVDDVEARANSLVGSTFRERVDEALVKKGSQKGVSLAPPAFLCDAVSPGATPIQKVSPFPRMVAIKGDQVALDLANITISE